MVFVVFRSPYSKADHLANLDLASLVLEDKDATQVPYRNRLVFDLRFQLKTKN